MGTKTFLIVAVALVLAGPASASSSTLAGRVARLEAKTRTLQTRTARLERQQSTLGAFAICSDALLSDLIAVADQGIDVLWNSAYGTATGPFYGASGTNDHGACAALGVQRTPFVVKFGLGPDPAYLAARIAAMRTARSQLADFVRHHR